jgi:hypothetical protein
VPWHSCIRADAGPSHRAPGCDSWSCCCHRLLTLRASVQQDSSLDGALAAYAIDREDLNIGELPCAAAAHALLVASTSTISRSITHGGAAQEEQRLAAALGEAAQSNRAAQQKFMRKQAPTCSKGGCSRAPSGCGDCKGGCCTWHMRGMPPAHAKHRCFSLNAIAVF